MTDNKKAIFFLRHNNDIDHIVPVLYKWLSTENISTDVIITTKRSLINDFRIEQLRQFKNVRIFHINDFFNKHTLQYWFNYFYFKDDTQADRFIKKFSLVRKKADKAIKKIADKIFKDMKEGFVAFDWTTTYFVNSMINIAKDKGFTTISLPHGDAPYVNYMIAKNAFNYSCLDSYEPSKIFDYIVVPNIHFFKRYEKYMDNDRIKILGSPRYCDEWIKIMSKFTPTFKLEGSEDKLKIVFFLRNTAFPIFWEEFVRTIKLIMQFPDVYMVVKHHPRSTASRRLTKRLIDFYPEIEENIGKNLKFIYGKENSSSLLNWADLVMDMGTSITWEAVKIEKPVLMPEYLHANYSTIAYYFKESEIKYKDQLYDTIKKFVENKNLKFYDEKVRERFIREVIDVPDKKVLERYVDFLKSCL